MATPEGNILLRIVQGQSGENADPNAPPSGNPLLAIARGESQFTYERPAPDPLGAIGAFGQGVKEGLLSPLKVFGVEPKLEPLTTTSEKVGSTLGNFAGLGLSFIPFQFGAGIVLRGIGMVAEIPQVIEGVETGAKIANPFYDFMKNVVAGSAQFGTMSDKIEDVPGNVAKGAAFGAGVEAFFLAKAMRGRAGAVLENGTVTAERMASEIAVTPTPAVTPEATEIMVNGLKIETGETPSDFSEITTKPEASAVLNPGKVGPLPKTVTPAFDPLHDVFTESKGPDNLTYPNVLLRLQALGESETVHVRDLQNPADFIKNAKQILPNAQVLSRPFQDGYEVLVHNPASDASRLSPKQLAQWQATGFPEGMEVNYTNAAGTKSYVTTGAPVAEGRVQLRDPLKKGITFAPKIEEVTRLTNPKFYFENSVEESIYQKALANAKQKVGFLVQTAPGFARRGFVDTSEYATVGSVREFINANKTEIQGLNIPDVNQAMLTVAQRKGIKGLVIENNGVQEGVHVFDQGTVDFNMQSRAKIDNPQWGRTADNAVVAPDLVTGSPTLNYFEPSWKNSLMQHLREAGVKELQARDYLDRRATELATKFNQLMGPEFKNIAKMVESNFSEGCL